MAQIWQHVGQHRWFSSQRYVFWKFPLAMEPFIRYFKEIRKEFKGCMFVCIAT